LLTAGTRGKKDMTREPNLIAPNRDDAISHVGSHNLERTMSDAHQILDVMEETVQTVAVYHTCPVWVTNNLQR
jgi:hypothetical protein